MAVLDKTERNGPEAGPADGRQGLKRRAEAYVVFPSIEGARGSCGTGKHGDYQQGRDKDLHDSVFLA